MKLFDLRKKKSILTNIVLGVLCTAIFSFYGCSPTAEEMMKKYETYQSILTNPEINQSGFSVSVKPGLNSIFVNFGNPVMSGYLKTMSERLYVANAENPTETLPVKIGSSTTTITKPNGEQTVTDGISIMLEENVKAKFILVGFKGIDQSESEELETPPLFFLVDMKAGEILTQSPLLAGDLIATDYSKIRFPVYRASLNSYVTRYNRNTIYEIELGNIGNDDQGYTYVDFLSKNINEDDWVVLSGQICHIEPLDLTTKLCSPLFMEIKVGNKTVYSKGYAVQTGVGIRELFNTKEMPDSIFVWSTAQLADPFAQVRLKLEKRIVFDGKTKEVIKK